MIIIRYGVICLLFIMAFCSQKEKEIKSASEYIKLAEKETSTSDKKQLLDSALMADSNNFDVYFERGRYFREIQQFDSSLKSFKKAIDIKPEDPKTYAEQSIIYTYMNKDTDALDNIKKALELDSMCSDAYFAWAKYYDNFDTGFIKANEMYCKVIQYDTLAVGAMYNLAWNYSKIGKNDSAYIILKKLIQIDSNSVSAWNNLGNYAAKLKKFKEALHAYNKALELDKLSNKTIMSRAITYLEVGDTASAIADFNRYLRFAPYKDERKPAVREKIIELGGTPKY